MDEKLIVVLLCIAMVFFELVPLFERGEKRLASVYAVFLGAATVLFFLFDSGLEIPSIGELLSRMSG